MELEFNLQLEGDIGFNLDLDPDCLEDQVSIGQSPSQTIGYPFPGSNPLSENCSGLFSNTSNEQNNDSIDSNLEINACEYSAFSQIGGKRKQQDKITIHQDSASNSQFFGIFDGFGDSSKISTYLSEQLHLQLFANSTTPLITRIKEIIKSIHCQISTLFGSDINKSGSTALFAIKTQENLVIVNLGDSRAVLFELINDSNQFIQLSTDHSANSNQKELDRIESKGGFIFDMRGIKRVQGELAVTRAFTNNESLARFVAEEPEITIIPLSSLKYNAKYKLILASDGLWNQLTNQDVLTFLIEREQTILQSEEENISKELYHYCLQENNYIRDNISIISVDLEI